MPLVINFLAANKGKNMANTKKILHLTPAAITEIQKHAPSPNKQGAWVSLAICEYARLLRESDNQTGTIERIDAKLNRLELTLNQILNQSHSRSPRRRLKPS